MMKEGTLVKIEGKLFEVWVVLGDVVGIREVAET
jgi:hypothetical protein